MPQLEIEEENIIQCFYFTFQRFLIYFIYLFVFRLVMFSAAQFTPAAKDYKICIHYVRQQILTFDIHFWLYAHLLQNLIPSYPPKWNGLQAGLEYFNGLDVAYIELIPSQQKCTQVKWLWNFIGQSQRKIDSSTLRSLCS